MPRKIAATSNHLSVATTVEHVAPSVPLKRYDHPVAERARIAVRLRYSRPAICNGPAVFPRCSSPWGLRLDRISVATLRSRAACSSTASAGSGSATTPVLPETWVSSKIPHNSNRQHWGATFCGGFQKWNSGLRTSPFRCTRKLWGSALSWSPAPNLLGIGGWLLKQLPDRHGQRVGQFHKRREGQVFLTILDSANPLDGRPN